MAAVFTIQYSYISGYKGDPAPEIITFVNLPQTNSYHEIVFFALEIVFQEQNMSQLARKKIDRQYTTVIYIKRMFFIYR